MLLALILAAAPPSGPAGEPYKYANLMAVEVRDGQSAPFDGWCLPEADARVQAKRLTDCEAGVAPSVLASTPEESSSAWAIAVAALGGAAVGAGIQARRKPK